MPRFPDPDLENFVYELNSHLSKASQYKANKLGVSAERSLAFSLASSGNRITSFTGKYSSGAKITSSISERTAIEDALSTFEVAAGKGYAITGHNIKMQDLPLLYERARSYGLGNRVKGSILGNLGSIIDVAENATPTLIKTENEFYRSAASEIEDLLGNKVIQETVAPQEVGLIGKMAKAKVGKNTLGGMLRYGTVFTATNILLPGGFAHNALSSAAFEGTRYGASKLGVKGWKTYAAGLGATVAFNTLWFGFNNKENRFSGFDDEYNTIEGLRHGGLSEDVRKALTDFGSGWDPMKAVARKLYKNVNKEEAFSLLKQSETFKTALKTALQGKGKVLGAGEMGEAIEYSLKFPGIRKKIPIVAKRGIVPKDAPATVPKSVFSSAWEKASKREASALSAVEGINAPSLYATGEELGLRKDILIMEKFSGESLKQAKKYPTVQETQQLYDIVREMHVKGVRHTDLHAGNIMRVKQGRNWLSKLFGKKPKEKMAVIDFGLANRISAKEMNKAWEIRQDAIQAGAEEALGHKVTRQEFEEALDIAEVQGHYLAGQGRTDEARRLKSYFSKFLYSQSDTEIINESKNLFQENLRAQALFNSKNTKHLTGSSLSSIEFEATQLDIGSAKTLPIEQPLLEQTTQNRKQALKRMSNFNEVSINAVGIGLRSAQDAGRKHRGFSSIKSA